MPDPGVSREKRISEEGLSRLEKQLRRGNISDMVLKQWIRRYGEPARELIKRYGKLVDDTDHDNNANSGD
jgi:hypothetical protein